MTTDSSPGGSAAYQARKAGFARLLTVYGRNAVQEALADPELSCKTLHIADSNRRNNWLKALTERAEQRQVDLRYHSRDALARISRNKRQDQGVALDVHCPAFMTLDRLLSQPPSSASTLLALDGITNPQNLGMLLRSATAGGIDGVLLARAGNATLGPLVIKASAGTVFRAPIIHCENLSDALSACQQQGYRVLTLSAGAGEDLFACDPTIPTVFVLGNESSGVSTTIESLADGAVGIAMARGVESLNVAVTASLIAFLPRLRRG